MAKPTLAAHHPGPVEPGFTDTEIPTSVKFINFQMKLNLSGFDFLSTTTLKKNFVDFFLLLNQLKFAVAAFFVFLFIGGEK